MDASTQIKDHKHIDLEIMGIINALNTFRLFLNKPFTIRTN